MSENTRPNPASLLLNQSRLVEQTSGGPTLHDAARRLLRQALKQNFPVQSIDPDQAMLMSPVWRQEGEELVTRQSLFESLTYALARQAFTQSQANYIEGEHFLTLTPHAIEPIHLPISMDAITALLNELAPQLFLGFEKSQLDYWNDKVDELPRWQRLSDTLKEALDVQSVNGWDSDQCALGRLVSRYPDKASRQISDSGLANVRACLLDLDLTFELAESSHTRHLMLAGALVLTASLGNRELIVMYTLTEGYESFSSMAQLGAILPERIDLDLSGQNLKWRLYEPEGNIFDAMVWALVGCQLDAIDALDPASRSPLTHMRQDESDILSVRDSTRMEQLADAMPEWLLAGSLEDIQAYSSYLTELGTLRDEADSEDFQDQDIPLIQPYAQQKMCDAIVAAKSAEGAATLPLNNIRITVTQSFEAGGFTLPDPHTRHVETLGEFALQNVRPYIATVAYADGTAVPDWMTVTFLVRLANEINIGATYPQLIKRMLIDDPVQARRHRTRYCRQLPLLLPLLALECKLKQQGGVDEQGYRQVCQLMASIESHAPQAEWRVRIHPLAFLPRYRSGSTPDTVTNMYIIGPTEGTSGPCLLYRPLLDQPLRQFPSEQNMLYAFYQPGELRDSILAWLPTPALSFEYAQYVFSSALPSLWTILDLAINPFIHLDVNASIDLANTPMDGDIMSVLYHQNSLAMAELADRQSTSNAERRWALLVDSGWAIFNVATNFLGGPAGVAVWVWQCIGQIQQALDAQERGDTMVEWSSVGDVLLTLGILLSHRMAVRRIRLSRPLDEMTSSKRLSKQKHLNLVPASKGAPTISYDSTALGGELPKTHLSTLAPHTLSQNSAGARFLLQIDGFKVPTPNLPESAQPNPDHLYELNGKLYAQVGERWFQVSAETDEPVFIVDPGNPERSGFELKYDEGNGRWHWNPKLRLRGGGPTGRIQALRREKLKNKTEALAALKAFVERIPTRKASLDQALQALGNEGTASEAAIDTYASTANELVSEYGQALENLEKLRSAGGEGRSYQSHLMTFTVEQHRYLNVWMRLKIREYAKIVSPLLSESEPSTLPRAEQLQAAQKAIALSVEIVECIERLQTSLNRLLMVDTGPTRKIAGDLKKLLPSFSRHDLEANEIGMSTELCLRDMPGSDTSEVRQLVLDIFEGSADAGHALAERRVTTDAQALDIDKLTALTDRLGESERRLLELSVKWADHLEPIRFARVQHLVAKFHQLARQRLLRLLPEPDETLVAAMARLESAPSTSRAIGRVSKSRPRTLEAQKTPSTDAQQASAELPIVNTTTRRPVQTTALDDDGIVAKGLDLNVDLDAFIRRIRSDAQRPSRVPADMKDLFDQQATRLEQSAKDVDAAIARRRTANRPLWPIGSLSDELRSGASKLRHEGIVVYGAMLMERKPRATNLQWLHEHDQIEIAKDARGRIKTKQRKDYFQEYRILDKTHQNKPLWVAHFHYDTVTDPDKDFTAAHLKFADGYLQTLPAKTREELNTFDAVDHALRRIINPAVRDLFLKPAP